MGELPAFRIEVPSGRAIFGRVYMDGVLLQGVTRVRFDTGEDINGMVAVTVTMLARDLAVSGETIVRLEPHDLGQQTVRSTALGERVTEP